MDTLLQQHERSEENKVGEHKNSAHTISKRTSRYGHSLPSRRIPTTTKPHLNNTPCERTPNRPKFKLGST
eukprot:13289838-Ditylum_brightwellii.AAC.1